MVTIASTIKNPPRLPVRKILKDILGPTYNVTLTYVGRARARTLNQRYRHKTYIPNVLAFPLDKKHGEIYLCPEAARTEREKFGFSSAGYLTYLVIHAALHLKGYRHGAAMEAKEASWCQTYQVR